MAVLKNKFLFLGALFLFILLIYLLVADEKLKADTEAWLSVFENTVQDTENASMRLLSLGKSDPGFTISIKETYDKRLAAFEYEGLLGDEKPMQYPNVLQFEAFLTSPLFCDLKEKGCFDQLDQEAEYINIVVKEFQPELSDFMSLDDLSSYRSLNPFIAEIKLQDFFFLFKLKGTEIYFDIDSGRLDKAAKSLEDLIKINRSFFADSDDLFIKISFAVNAENIFQPLLMALKNAGYPTQGKFEKVLSPLSLQEISANDIQIRSFAKNARLIKAGLAAREQNSSGTIISRIWHRFVYKENMTLNDMFDEYQHLLLPPFVNKASLLAFSKNIDREIIAKREEQEQRPFLYRFKNITNVVGASLKDVVMPRQINVYESTAKLDSRLQLLRLALNAEKEELIEYIQLEEYANYYTGEKPYIQDGKLCQKLNDEDVCVTVIN